MIMHSDRLNLIDLIPDPPDIPDDLLAHCRERDDYRQILFEYYKYVATLCVISSYLEFESPAWTGGKRLRWVVLVGLLTRCHRIMGGHLEFWQDDRYGDLSRIFDRCLLETCTKIRWIASDPTDVRLRRYLEDGLKGEAEQVKEINRNIEARGGEQIVIEQRMLEAIQNTLEAAEMSMDDLASIRKGPPLSAMFEDLGERRFVYTVMGKLASHAVHGSWPNLLNSYLEGETKESLRPRANPQPSHINQYVINSLYVLDACLSYVEANFNSDEIDTLHFLEVLRAARDEIWELNLEIAAADFAPVGGE